MKKLILFLLIVCTLSISAQDKITGKWYVFSDSKCFELQFNDSSIVAKGLKKDFSYEPQRKSDILELYKTIYKNNNVYCIDNRIESIDQLEMVTFKIIDKDKGIIFVINSKDKFEDTVSLSDYIAKDTSEKFGLNLYNENEFQKIKTFPDLKTITKEKLKLYLSKELVLKNFCDSISSLKVLKNSRVSMYKEGKLNDIAIELGFSPFNDDNDIEKLADKFLSDPEIRDLQNAINKHSRFQTVSPDVEIKK